MELSITISNNNMIISISGTGGSGKSTLAKRLAKNFNYAHYSMGDLQRQIAKEKGMTIVELGELEKTDPTIDKMIDDKQVRLGKEEDSFVIDGRMAAKFIPHAIKIFLGGDTDVLAKRILGERESETHKNLQEAIEFTTQREKTNRERWINFYGYDFTDEKNYDLVVDTTDLNADQVFEKVLSFVKMKNSQ